MPEMTSYRHGVPSWIDVSAPDIEATGQFYADLLGLTLGEDLGPDGGGYRMLLKDGKTVAGIGPVTEGAPPSWSTYINVDDVDAAAARVSAAGGTVVVPPMDLPFESGRIAFALDPTGGFFGLFQRGPNHFGAHLVNEHGTLAWNELTVRDASTALGFYRDVIGWTADPMDEGAPEGYQLIKVDDRAVAGCMPMDDQWPEGIPTHWMTYFAVDDTDAIAARCAELGGAVSVPPTDIPVGRFAVLNDPNGAVFSVITMPEIDDPNAW